MKVLLSKKNELVISARMRVVPECLSTGSDSTYFGLSSGSGSLRAAPAGCFSASSMGNR